MQTLGTPFTTKSTKLMLLGSGELGKEVAIEAQRYGIHVIAVDRYANAPAMQVATESHVISMLDPVALETLIRKLKPDFIVPEIEAIHTATLVSLEKEGFRVVPSAKAVHLTMNREGIRNFASIELGLPTSKYEFAENFSDFETKAKALGFPCVVKPIMSSSGKGQSVIRNSDEIHKAWEKGQSGGRAGQGKMILEEFIPFDFEITLLTIRHIHGTTFLEPIGHRQVNGDYVESWTPLQGKDSSPYPGVTYFLSEAALKKSQEIAEKITTGLGGYGLFGVELFIKGDEVYFSEVSPRPHDTGLVTLVSQSHSEFHLHLRALLGMPMPEIRTFGPSASAAVLLEGHTTSPEFSGLDTALSDPQVEMRIFGKPEIQGSRRMGVALARGNTLATALDRAHKARLQIRLLS